MYVRSVCSNVHVADSSAGVFGMAFAIYIHLIRWRSGIIGTLLRLFMFTVEVLSAEQGVEVLNLKPEYNAIMCHWPMLLR